MDRFGPVVRAKRHTAAIRGSAKDFDMTRLRLCFASLLFTVAAGACVTTANSATLKKPAVVETSIDRATVREKLAARRTQTVKHFLEYRDRGVYPVNQLPGGGFRHVWVDGAGNLCAAATLISKDWGREAAIQVGMKNLEIKLADVKSGAVLDWMLTSGLTRAELVAIQLPGDTWLPGEAARVQEIARMKQIYQDVERQIRSLWDANLELAVDELMKRPELAKKLVG
jgi:hypothetical protein